MIALIQRVTEAKVVIEDKIYSNINNGLVVFLGICNEDNKDDADWLVKKIVNLRIFDDADGVMNMSLLDMNYEILTVSQFTLHAKTKKGNRPSYIEAAKPPLSIELYDYFNAQLNSAIPTEIQSGVFGENMQISLCNDGPVTIIIDTKNKK